MGKPMTATQQQMDTLEFFEIIGGVWWEDNKRHILRMMPRGFDSPLEAWRSKDGHPELIQWRMMAVALANVDKIQRSGR